IGVTLLHVITSAFAGNGAQINQLGTLSSSQSVTVVATDDFRSLTVSGGIAGGFVGVAAGVDIGVANSSVSAFLGGGSNVNATADVTVAGLSRKNVQTYAVSIGGGFVGAAGSVSVWSIGTQSSSKYNDTAGGTDRGTWVAHPDKGTWTSPTLYSTGDVATDPDNGHRYMALVNGPKHTAADKPHTNPAQWSTTYNDGDVVTYGGKRYGARVDGPDPTKSPDTNPDQWDTETDALASQTPPAGTDKGPWSSITAYNKNDIVKGSDGSKYQAVKSNTGEDPTLAANNGAGGDWTGYSGAGSSSAQGSADETPAGNKDSDGAPGYKNVLMGTSASGPSAWVSGTTYHAGDKVSFSGHDYKAKTGITAVAAPAWVSGTAYVTGNEVSFGGQNYIAKDNTVNVTVDPATNTSEWLVDDATTDPAHNGAQWLLGGRGDAEDHPRRG